MSEPLRSASPAPPHPPLQGTGSGSSQSQSQSEELIAKYKNLLNMARKSLEANKETISEKDKSINNLKQQLQEAKKSSSSQSGGKGSKSIQGGDDGSTILRQILCMAEDSTGRLWVLFEYTSSGERSASGATAANAAGHSDSWVMFGNEQELDEYLQRVCSNGPPVLKPARLLTADESMRIQQESNSKIDLITEEFRRFKVRVEIARKQKNAETTQQLNSFKSTNQVIATQSPPLAAGNCFNCMKYQEDIQKLQSKLAVLSSKVGVERIGRSGSQDRGDLANMVISNDSNVNSSAGHRASPRSSNAVANRPFRKDSNGSPNSMASRGSKEDFSLSFSRVGGNGSSDRLVGLSNNISSSSSAVSKKKKSSSSSGTAAYGPVDAMDASKIAYARQMLIQYLSCKDILVKGFIEDALCKLFRFTDEELKTIVERRDSDVAAAGGKSIGSGSARGGSDSNSNSSSTWSSILGLASS